MSRTVLAAGCIGLINRYGWLDRPTGTIEYGTNDSPDIGADTMLENASEKGTIDTLPDIPGGGGYSLAQRSHRNLYRRRQSDTRRQHPSRRYYLRCFRQRLYALAQDTVYHLYGEYRIRKNSVRREQSCRTEHGGRFFHNLVV